MHGPGTSAIESYDNSPLTQFIPYATGPASWKLPMKGVESFYFRIKKPRSVAGAFNQGINQYTVAFIKNLKYLNLSTPQNLRP
jgi:hypothetical protein